MIELKCNCDGKCGDKCKCKGSNNVLSIWGILKCA